MNCERYRWKAEKQTWLQSISIPYYHVLGKEDLENPYEFDNSNRILYIRVPDDYCSLPKKVIRALHACHKELNCEYIFKTDDDQVLTDLSFFDRLLQQIADSPAPVHYGGHICRVETEGCSGYWEYHDELPRDIYLYKNAYCNGRFYVLSRTAVEHLIERQPEIEKHYFEDYIVGYCLPPQIKENIFEIDNNVFIDM
jgi:hypothetical protein